MNSRDDLVVKEIEFMGDALMAAKDRDGTIYAGVSYICNGIGLTKSQKDSQVEKVQKDMLLSKGCRKFPAGVFDCNNETVALKIAKKIGVTEREYGHYETGYRKPKIETLIKLADFYNVSIDYLVGRSDKRK